MNCAVRQNSSLTGIHDKILKELHMSYNKTKYGPISLIKSMYMHSKIECMSLYTNMQVLNFIKLW